MERNGDIACAMRFLCRTKPEVQRDVHSGKLRLKKLKPEHRAGEFEKLSHLMHIPAERGIGAGDEDVAQAVCLGAIYLRTISMTRCSRVSSST